MTPQAITRIKTACRSGAAVLGAALALALAGPPAMAQPIEDEEEKDALRDITDDGVVNIFDFSLLGPLFGLRAGEAGYREGLDLVPDGIIDPNDLREILRSYLRPAETDGTKFSGRVFDGLGNGLPGVEVIIKDGPYDATLNFVKAITDPLGNYSVEVPATLLGERFITFDGSTVDPDTQDPTPGSPNPPGQDGQYPTIPNKPIFVNGGIDNVFRDMSLPERDLNGSVDLSQGGIATNTGGNTWLLNQDVGVQNAGVKLDVPAGCTAIFPDGENPVLSITRVDPSRLPVPMPPGLASTIFVTYQPGGTEIDCPGGEELVTVFDNTDGFDPLFPPFLAGITNGVFTPLVGCEVVDDPTNDIPDDRSKVECRDVPTPFEFAWYHVDIQPTDICGLPGVNPRFCICPRTAVIGTVRSNADLMPPLPGARVSVWGAAQVTTDPLGNFRIPNVPAGPNGFFCFTRPFNIRASARFDFDDPPNGIQFDETAVSNVVRAVPGGNTNLGDLKVGRFGTVQGTAQKLSRISPRLVIPIPGASVALKDPATGQLIMTAGDNPTTTGANGAYAFQDVPSGGYKADFDADNVTLPLPGGGEAQKSFSDSVNGSIFRQGEIDVRNFDFVSEGMVEVTVENEFGDPVPFAEVTLSRTFERFGGAFSSPTMSCSGESDVDGIIKFPNEAAECNTGGNPIPIPAGFPMGRCTVGAALASGNAAAVIGPDECVINEHGELVELTATLLPTGPGPGDALGDVIALDIGTGLNQDQVPVVIVTVTYDRLPDRALLFELIQPPDILFEIDLDQDPDSGLPAQIDGLFPGANTNLAVDLKVHCTPETFGDCEAFDGSGTSLGIVDRYGFIFEENQVIFQIPEEIVETALQNCVAGTGTLPVRANAALLSRQDTGFQSEIPGALIGDIVPNNEAGHVEVSIGGFNATIPDPLTDTVLIFNGNDF